MTTTAAFDWRDARLNARLRVALLAALILHAGILVAVVLRAAAVDPPRPPITIQLQPLPEPEPVAPPEPAPAPKPAPKSAAAPKAEAPAPAPAPTPAPTPTPAPEAPVPTAEKPVPQPVSQPLPTPPAPAETPKPAAAPLPPAPEPAAAPQPAPAPVVANRPPPPPPVTPAAAAAAAQQLARAALQTLAPTPDAGDEPTDFGAPVAAPADAPPAPVVAATERPSVGAPAADYDETSNARRVAGIDKNLAAGSPAQGNAPAAGVLAAGTERGSSRGGGSAGVLWEGDGEGCGEPVVDPPPATGGIDSGGMTYHIDVQFRLDGTGLVLSPRIVSGSGNTQLDNAVLSAARGMRFDCTSEARGRRTYKVNPGGR